MSVEKHRKENAARTPGTPWFGSSIPMQPCLVSDQTLFDRKSEPQAGRSVGFNAEARRSRGPQSSYFDRICLSLRIFSSPLRPYAPLRLCVKKSLFGFFTVSLLLGLASITTAAEITTNGLGGGRWSEGDTWRGGKVPGPEDVAVIAARDAVLFDRDDAEAVTCKQLVLDPGSSFAFQSGLGKRTLTVNGPIEVYGSLKMHAPGITDSLAIRLNAEVYAERVITVARGGGLLVLGKANLPGGKKNVSISVSAPPVAKVEQMGELNAGEGTMIDIQNAHLDNLAVMAVMIDNTGAKPNERCNFVGNRFTKQSRLTVSQCDSAAVVRNIFETQQPGVVRPHGLAVSSSPLADIRSNTLTGKYAIGISINSSESMLTGNTVDGSVQGVIWHTGPAMMKQTAIRNCDMGLFLRTVSGGVEDTTIENCKEPLRIWSSKAQLTNATIVNPGADLWVETVGSSVSFLNGNVRPEKIKVEREGELPRAVADDDPAVQAYEFLIVGLTGTVPPRADVEVRTANPATPPKPGAMDLNVRNSPAPLRGNKLTALPATLTPLMVKSWTIDANGKLLPAPEYALSVREIPTGEGVEPKVLKTLKLTPDEKWFRAKPNDPVPTLEVTLP
jgi:hypothetical protein